MVGKLFRKDLSAMENELPEIMLFPFLDTLGWCPLSMKGRLLLRLFPCHRNSQSSAATSLESRTIRLLITFIPHVHKNDWGCHLDVPLGKALVLQWTCRAYRAPTCRSMWSCRNFCITGLKDTSSCFSSSSCSLLGAASCSSSSSGFIS